MIKYYIAKLVKKLHFPAVKNSVMHKHSKACPGSHILNSDIGRYSYVGNFSTVVNCSVGDFCSIADHCTIGNMSHPLNWISTSPVMYAGQNCLRKNFSNNDYDSSKKTIIENDVWIADGCFIKAGVHIATGSVIGMGSVLTKDTGPYEIWAGNPAKKIRDRFDSETCIELMRSKWWTWDEYKLKTYANSFNDASEFLKLLRIENDEPQNSDISHLSGSL